MEFELTQEVIQEIGLNEQQVAKVVEFAKNKIGELEQSWSGAANVNAEKIIDGAAKKVEELTGIKREKGQKVAEYLTLASENYFKGQKSTLERKEQELNDKLKNLPGSEIIARELETTKEQLLKLKEKEARFAEWEENDYKGKWESANNELNSIKVELEFDKVKPQLPDNVNLYEFDYKWSKFIQETLEKYTIKDGIAIDKENEFKKVKLSDLVKKDENILSLTKGSVKGIGSQKGFVKIENVPFDVPENANPQERIKAIREYLASKGIPVTSNEYATQFAELNQKILLQKTA
jgi:hypothetical protein